MSSSPSSFSNNGKVTPTTLVFTQPMNNNFTINNSGSGTQIIRQASSSNGSLLQPISTGILSSPTSIVRLNQPGSNLSSTQFTPQTVWTNNTGQSSPKLQYSPVVKNDSITSVIPQQTTIVQGKLVAQPVVPRTVPSAPASTFTESQIRDFVAKCRTFLLTLLKLAEKQAPEKLPMVRSCIQDLLNGTIDPESFTRNLHTLYKSQPHTSLVPFFRLALPHMREIVEKTFHRPITIELLEKLNLPSSNSSTTTNIATNNIIKANTPSTSSSCVVVNPSLLSQTTSSTSSPSGQQPLLYTTVQPQQKINLLQQNPPTQTFISSTTSLLGQQQQLQQQARAQINITGIRPIIATVTPSSNTNLLNPQQHIQPVTQTIIPQTDSSVQRTFLASTTVQPQIITINQQTIKTEPIQPATISTLQQPFKTQIQQKPAIQNEEDSTDDHQNLLTTGPIDDRHARHITHDDRFLSSQVLRRHFDHLIKKSQRWEGGPISIHDDSTLAMISNATEERLKTLIEQLQLIARQRTRLLGKGSSSNEQINHHCEQDSHDQADQFIEKTKSADNYMQPMETDDSSDPTGLKRKRQTEEINSHHASLKSKKKTKTRSSRPPCRANLQDILLLMKSDKHLRRSSIYLKALD